MEHEARKVVDLRLGPGRSGPRRRCAQRCTRGSEFAQSLAEAPHPEQLKCLALNGVGCPVTSKPLPLKQPRWDRAEVAGVGPQGLADVDPVLTARQGAAPTRTSFG